VLAPADVRRLAARASKRRCGKREKLIVLLSFRAGLRACEIAGLDWTMVVTPRGDVSSTLAVDDSIAKNGRGRRLPVHPKLAAALKHQHKQLGKPRNGLVIPSRYGRHLRPRSIVNWFCTIYDELGLQGCSSHSGRRTFITRAARSVHKAGGSLKGVQELAGHSALTTIERYIEGDRDAQRRLVRML
jgi:integrase/recombinase XerD